MGYRLGNDVISGIFLSKNRSFRMEAEPSGRPPEWPSLKAKNMIKPRIQDTLDTLFSHTPTCTEICIEDYIGIKQVIGLPTLFLRFPAVYFTPQRCPWKYRPLGGDYYRNDLSGSWNLPSTLPMGLPSGNLTQLWIITIFNGKTPYKWPFSIAMLVYQRVLPNVRRLV